MPQHTQDTGTLITPIDMAPAPVTSVGDMIVRALGVGVGAACLTCAGAWLLQLPADTIGKASGVAFLVTTGAALPWLLLSVEAWRKMGRSVRLERAKKLAAYDAIRRLEYTVADQRETISRLQSQRTTPQPATPANLVLSHNVAPDNTECALRILNHWFDTGTWYSRRLAKDGGWPQPTHDAAIRLLKDMGMVAHEPGKVPSVLPRFGNKGQALEHFNNFCDKVLTGPQLPGRNTVMSNEDDDD